MKNESEQSEAFTDLMNDNPKGVYELAAGLTSEEMMAAFFDSSALVESPKPVYRLQGSNHRFYYTFDESGNPDFYTSVTTMIKQTMPTSPHLIKWIADMGYDESKIYAAERADYGTFMHIEIASLLINKTYDTEQIKPRLKAYIEAEKLPSSFINHSDELKKDILAFAQFMIDCNVKPLAIEIVLTHPDGYGGAIDLVCEMSVEVKGFFGEHFKTGARAGEPKETKQLQTFTAIVDFKSGRKGFYEEHEIQLQAYSEMWQHHFPNKPVERFYNWSPKDWRTTTPTYNLKDQTDSKSRYKLQHLVQLAGIERNRRNNTVTIVNGVIDLKAGLGRNVIEMTLSDLVKKRKNEAEKPKK